MTEIDLVVVNYKTPKLVQRLMDCLNEDDDGETWSLHVIDNASGDDSVELLDSMYRSRDYKISTLMRSSVNMGFARACNLMADRGKAKYIGLLNADVWMNTSDVKGIIKSFEENHSADIIGPKQRDEDGYITHAGIFGPNDKPAHRGWKKYDPDDKWFKDFVPATTVSGSAYFVRRNRWEELTDCKIYKKFAPHAKGAFLPTQHYYEETFCSYHARAHVMGVYYDGRVSIGHTWHASSPVGGHADGLFSESREIFRRACDAHDIARD